MRRLVTFLMVAAIAVAGALPPHYAMAAKHPKPSGHISAPHVHVSAAVMPYNAATPCDHHKTSQPDAPAIDHPCCVSACSAIAFIFANIDVDDFQWVTEYSATPIRVLRAVPPTAADPPPKAS